MSGRGAPLPLLARGESAEMPAPLFFVVAHPFHPGSRRGSMRCTAGRSTQSSRRARDPRTESWSTRSSPRVSLLRPSPGSREGGSRRACSTPPRRSRATRRCEVPGRDGGRRSPRRWCPWSREEAGASRPSSSRSTGSKGKRASRSPCAPWGRSTSCSCSSSWRRRRRAHPLRGSRRRGRRPLPGPRLRRRLRRPPAGERERPPRTATPRRRARPLVPRRLPALVL